MTVIETQYECKSGKPEACIISDTGWRIVGIDPWTSGYFTAREGSHVDLHLAAFFKAEDDLMCQVLEKEE